MKWIWNKMKWISFELLKIGSNKQSFFSKKRIESGIAFVLAQVFMIIYFIHKYNGMDIYDFSLFVGIEFAIAGYIINLIQRQKKEEVNKDE